MQNVVSFRTIDSSNKTEVTKPVHMRILIADDHDLVRDTIGMFLEAEGMAEIVAVENLDAAIEATDKTGSFDLVLLDFNMPGTNAA